MNTAVEMRMVCGQEDFWCVNDEILNLPVFSSKFQNARTVVFWTMVSIER